MTDLDTHISRLEELNAALVGGDLVDLAIMPAAEELLLAIKNRVVNQGIGTDGNALRQYSTQPIYVTKNQFIKGGFNAQGKNNVFGNTLGDRIIPAARLKSNGIKKNKRTAILNTLVKPNYQERKSMYLKDGYKELRDIQGLRTDITNMRYSGQMLEDYQAQKMAQSVLLGIVTERSAEIYNGQTYGTSKMSGRGLFFVANEQEKQEFLNRTLVSLTRLTRGYISGVTATVE